MQLVSGIGEVDHVGDGMLRQARLTLCQQIGLLMLVAQKPLRRRIALPENDMPDDTETRRFPCLEKHVDLVPRSEEHTSELQSLMRISSAVFCLKKKK